MPHEIASIELVRRAQAGEPEALDRLFERYYPRVRAIVRTRLGQELRAALESQDLIQETFLAAVEGFDRFELHGEASLVNWLARLAETQIRDAARRGAAAKRDRRRERALEALRASWSSGRLAFAPAISVELPPALVADEEEQALVEAGVAELEAEGREVMLLRHWVGASWREIAAELGLATERAARVAHARALIDLGLRLRRQGLRE